MARNSAWVIVIEHFFCLIIGLGSLLQMVAPIQDNNDIIEFTNKKTGIFSIISINVKFFFMLSVLYVVCNTV